MGDTIATVTTDDGVTIESNSDTQAELEAAVAAPVEETPAAPVDGEPPAQPRDEAGKFRGRGRKRSDPIARMEDATAKEAEAKRERDALKAERDKLAAELAEARKATTQPPTPVAVTATPPAPALPPATAEDWRRYSAMAQAPKREQFADPAEYSAALSAFVAETRFHELRAIETAHQQDVQRFSSAQERARTMYAKVTNNGTEPEVIAKIDPVLLNAPPATALPRGATVTFENFLVELAYKSDHPKEVLLHLSNQQERQRLASLPPDEVIRQLAIFDATVSRPPAAPSTGPAAPAPPVSQAKPVFQPVAGSAPAASNDEPPGDDASDAAHEAYWGPRRRKLRSA